MPDQPATTTEAAPARTTPASLLRAVPISTFMRDGTLRLADGRLSFATRRDVVFDHAVSECHSVARAAATGFHVWHADRCYKLIPEYTPVPSLDGANAAVEIAVNLGRISQARAADRMMRSSRDAWVELLEPLVGRPPAGARVRPPWPTWAIMLSVVGVALVIIAIITAIALAAA